MCSSKDSLFCVRAKKVALLVKFDHESQVFPSDLTSSSIFQRELLCIKCVCPVTLKTYSHSKTSLMMSFEKDSLS